MSHENSSRRDFQDLSKVKLYNPADWKPNEMTTEEKKAYAERFFDRDGLEVKTLRNAKMQLELKGLNLYKIQQESLPAINYVRYSGIVNSKHVKYTNERACCWLEKEQELLIFCWEDFPSHYEQFVYFQSRGMTHEAYEICLAVYETKKLRKKLKEEAS